MKLLLDEMYSPVIAEQVGSRGHDVEAVAARSELRALADEGIFDVAQQEGRTVVTENIADFCEIVNRQDTSGQSHYGLVLVNPSKHPRGEPRAIGRMVSELDRLLKEHPADEPTSPRHWL
ncbi:MAG TPA: DUF5615 family PIN-like protein [Solirubrobacteraceae bacterium]